MSFGGGSFNYFDAATGSNAYERQSWRDSYNGGYAAGDFTGNVNASLSDQRDNFQGATWSGSSTQPSALQLAQSMGGPGHSAVSNGPQSSVSTGPGNAVVVSAPRKPIGGNLTFTTGAGPGNGVVTSHPGIKDKKLERIGNGGIQEAPGAVSDIGWTHSGAGYVVVPSSDVKERIEDDFFTQSQWSWRNVWGPAIGALPQPQPEFLNPRNSYFDMLSGGWREGQASQPWHAKPSIVGGGF